ncbi:MAG: hypothetical protein HC820_08105 [Hydrococcus sp. RM1_1_31]|nr:hypothetical protein [Hydrococcus sp. RM1_1_31]
MKVVNISLFTALSPIFFALATQKSFAQTRRPCLPNLGGVDVSQVRCLSAEAQANKSIEDWLIANDLVPLWADRPPSYAYNLIDLNGDEIKEAIVLVRSTNCGRGGCPTFILKQTGRNQWIEIGGSLGGDAIVTNKRTNGIFCCRR